MQLEYQFATRLERENQLVTYSLNGEQLKYLENISESIEQAIQAPTLQKNVLKTS